MAEIIDLQDRLSREHGIAPAYRVVRIDRGRRTGPVQAVDARTDAQAKARALALLRGHTVELWDRKRFVARLRPDTPPVATLIRLVGDPPPQP